MHDLKCAPVEAKVEVIVKDLGRKPLAYLDIENVKGRLPKIWIIRFLPCIGCI